MTPKFTQNVNSAIAAVDSTMDAGAFDVINDQMDSWCRQTGIITEVSMSNLMIILYANVSGLRGLNFYVDKERQCITCYAALKWYKYYFSNSKRKFLESWGSFIADYFPTFNIIVEVRKYKKNWLEQAKTEYDEFKRKQRQSGRAEFIKRFRTDSASNLGQQQRTQN